MSDAENPPEDPRELARRLAEQAKARAAAPPAEDPRELARRLAEEAKARASVRTSVAPVAPPQPAAPEKRSLADRAAKPLSPQEALRLAIEEEARQAAAPKVVVTRSSIKPGASPPAAAQPAPAAAPRPAAAQPAAAPRPAEPVTVRDPSALLGERLAGAHVLRVLPVNNRVVFQALWQAHRARAAVEGDIALLVAADALVDAAHRVPEGALFAAELSWRGEAWAVWLDAARGAPLAAARHPELLLAGL